MLRLHRRLLHSAEPARPNREPLGARGCASSPNGGKEEGRRGSHGLTPRICTRRIRSRFLSVCRGRLVRRLQTSLTKRATRRGESSSNRQPKASTDRPGASTRSLELRRASGKRATALRIGDPRKHAVDHDVASGHTSHQADLGRLLFDNEESAWLGSHAPHALGLHARIPPAFVQATLRSGEPTSTPCANAPPSSSFLQ